MLKCQHGTVLEEADAIEHNFSVSVTDEIFIGYSEKGIKGRKILLEKVIGK